MIWTLLRMAPQAQSRYILHVAQRMPDVEIYYPQYRKKTRPANSRHLITKTLPVYPGYLFTRLDSTRIRPLLQTPIRVHFVRFGPSLSIVPDRVILQIRHLESLNMLMRESVRAAGREDHVLPTPLASGLVSDP